MDGWMDGGMHVRVGFWRVVPFVRWLLTNEQCLVFRGEVEGTWGFLIFDFFFPPQRCFCQSGAKADWTVSRC